MGISGHQDFEERKNHTILAKFRPPEVPSIMDPVLYFGMFGHDAERLWSIKHIP